MVLDRTGKLSKVYGRTGWSLLSMGRPFSFCIQYVSVMSRSIIKVSIVREDCVES
jgi:hypothetical protein